MTLGSLSLRMAGGLREGKLILDLGELGDDPGVGVLIDVLEAKRLAGDRVAVPLGVEFPESLPELLFDDLAVEIAEETRAFSVSGRSSAKWELVTEWLTIRDLSVALLVVPAAEGAGRAIRAYVGGTLGFGGVDVFVVSEAGEESALRGTIPRIRLSRICRALPGLRSLPAGVADVELSDVHLSAMPASRELELYGAVTGDWAFPLGGGEIKLSEVNVSFKRGAGPIGGAAQSGWLSLSVGIRSGEPSAIAAGVTVDDLRLDFSARSGGGWAASGRSTVDLLGMRVGLGAEYEIAHGEETHGGLALEGGIAKLEMSRVAETLLGGAALPPELPDIEFEDVEVSVTPTTGAFSLSGTASIDLGLGGGAVGARVDLALDRDGDGGQVDCTLALRAKGPVELADAATLEALSLDFVLDQKASWSVSGGLKAALFGGRFDLEAGYEQTGGTERNLYFEASGLDRRLLSIKELGATLKLSRLRLEAGTSRKRGHGGLRALALSSDTKLRLGKHLEIDGSLAFSHKPKEATGIRFDVTMPADPLRVPVPPGLFPPGVKPGLAIHGAGLGISRDPKGWRLEGDAKLRFVGFPRSFPVPRSRVEGRITLDRERFSASALNVAGLPAIPLGTVPNTDRELGEMNVGLREIGVFIESDGDIGFLATPDVRLEPRINEALFGRNREGEVREVLKTDGPFGLTLSFGIVKGKVGANLKVLQSPFAKFQIEERADGRMYWPCDLGPFGMIAFEVPEADFTAGSFRVSGGFKEDPKRKLQIPLTLIKNALAERVPEIDSLIPSALPLLEKPKLLSKGAVLTDDLIRYVNKIGKPYLGPGGVPAPLKKALRRLAALGEGLPDRLRWYLEADLPNDFHFEVAVNPSGSLTMEIEATEGRPVTALIPSQAGIYGLTLRSLTFGPILGGSLFLLKLDADVDYFDAPTLVAAVAASQAPDLGPWLPDPKKALSMLRARDLTMFIFYQAGVPIPIPLFYTELSVDSMGPGGFGFKTGLSFNPLAGNSILDAFASLSDLYPFVTDEDARLSTDSGLELKAGITETKLTLPPYLGGAEVGSQGDPLLEVDFWHMFVHAANGIKFFDPGELLRALPVAGRSGSIDVTVATIGLRAAWVATSREEFEQGIEWGAGAEQAGLLDLVPRTPAAEAGPVFLIAGTGRIGNHFSITGRFGLAYAGREGFATGVHLAASLASAVAFEIQGEIGFDFTGEPGTGTGGFSGKGRLDLAGETVLHVEAEMTPARISFRGSVDSLPGLDVLALDSDLIVVIDGKHFLVSTETTVKLFGLAAAGSLELDHAGLRVRANASGAAAQVAVDLDVAALDQPEAVTVSGSIVAKPATVARAVALAKAEYVAKLKAAISEIDRRAKRDRNRKPKDREHTAATWQSIRAAAVALRDNLSASGIGGKILDQALAFVPARVRSGIKHLRAGKELFTDLTIDYAGALGAARGGRVTLTVSGKYAGASFGKKKVTAELDAKTLAKTLGKAVVDAVL